MNPRESLLGTFPGRLFIEHLRSAGAFPEVLASNAWPEWSIREFLIHGAIYAISRYLYSDDCLEIADFDVDAPGMHEFDAAALAALAELSTFDSPQIHQGAVSRLRTPNIRNRNPLNALPYGAFWTSTPITEDQDSWTLSGENLNRESPRWAVHFDMTSVRVAQVDSATDWVNLIESHAVTADGCTYPDWPAIAQSWDAVHVSPAGLLLAHPTIAGTPLITTDGSGYAHSQAGPYASVASWSTVSTAWLREAPNVELRPAVRS